MPSIQHQGALIRSARQQLEIRQLYSDDIIALSESLRSLLISTFEGAGEPGLGSQMADSFVPIGKRISTSRARSLAEIETAIESGATIERLTLELLEVDLGL